MAIIGNIPNFQTNPSLIMKTQTSLLSVRKILHLHSALAFPCHLLDFWARPPLPFPHLPPWRRWFDDGEIQAHDGDTIWGDSRLSSFRSTSYPHWNWVYRCIIISMSFVHNVAEKEKWQAKLDFYLFVANYTLCYKSMQIIYVWYISRSSNLIPIGAISWHSWHGLVHDSRWWGSRALWWFASTTPSRWRRRCLWGTSTRRGTCHEVCNHWWKCLT